eukprot:875179_1
MDTNSNGYQPGALDDDDVEDLADDANDKEEPPHKSGGIDMPSGIKSDTRVSTTANSNASIEIVTVSLSSWMDFATDGVVTCSGNQNNDKTYHGAFNNDKTSNENHPNHTTKQRGNDKRGNSHREKDDDNKGDNDEECNNSITDLPCNHFNECTSCETVLIRKNDQIQLYHGLVGSLQSQIDHNVIYNALILKQTKSKPNQTKSKPKQTKSKRKKKRRGKQNAQDIDVYPVRTINRVKNIVHISQELSEQVIPDTINETISNVYGYMDRVMAMQYNDGYIVHQNNNMIINFDFH